MDADYASVRREVNDIRKTWSFRTRFLFRIPFTIVSEPPAEDDQNSECVDVGSAYVDLFQVRLSACLFPGPPSSVVLLNSFCVPPRVVTFRMRDIN